MSCLMLLMLPTINTKPQKKEADILQIKSAPALASDSNAQLAIKIILITMCYPSPPCPEAANFRSKSPCTLLILSIILLLNS